jgi:glycosyltransferase involved in cell wall biosynthesis
MGKAARYRVALIAGGLALGGAEKQLVYMARALVDRGVALRCYSLTRGDAYEEAIRRAGAEPIWIGRRRTPAARLARLAYELARFRPHVVQAGHFFVNLYAALGASACGAVSVGALRNDAVFEMGEHGRWGPWLLRLPTVLVANSAAGCRNARTCGRTRDGVLLLPNVIDLSEFDAVRTGLDLRAESAGATLALAVGRLVAAKRFDRFLEALARARRDRPELQGVIVGDGPERGALEALAAQIGLAGAGVRFLGARRDVPALLRQADMLVLCSDHEGFPNVLLEAMAARLPVITTPAGDARAVVLPGVTAYVVEPHDVEMLSVRMCELAAAPARRRAMGRAGRRRVESVFRPDLLADRLLEVYRTAEERRGRRTSAGLRLLDAVAAPARASLRVRLLDR